MTIMLYYDYFIRSRFLFLRLNGHVVSHKQHQNTFKNQILTNT